MEPDDYGFDPGVPGGTPAPPPDPFTTADNLRLQQFNAGLATLDNEVNDGALHPDHAVQLRAQIESQRQPLLAKQQATVKMARQQQLQMLHEDTAASEALQHQNAVFRSKGFRDRVVPFTDPLSGETAYLYEQAPNKWAQIELGGQGDGDSGGPLYFPLAAGLTPASDQDEGLPGAQYPEPHSIAPYPPPDQESERRPTMGQPEAGGGGAGPQAATGASAPAASASPPQAVPNGDGTHTMEIWNGPNRELLTFKGNQIVDRQAFDREGNPVTQGQQGPELSLAQMNVLRNRAENATPQIQFQGDPRNFHDVTAFHAMQQERQRHVDSLIHSWANQAAQRQQQQQQQAGQESLIKQREQVRKDDEARKKQDREDKEATDKKHQAAHDDFDKRAGHYYDTFVKQRAEIDKHNNQRPGKDQPPAEKIPLEDFLQTHESMQDKAHEMALTDMIRRGKVPPGMEEEANALRAKMKRAKAGGTPGTPGPTEQQKALQELLDRLGGAPNAGNVSPQTPKAPSGLGELQPLTGRQ